MMSGNEAIADYLVLGAMARSLHRTLLLPRLFTAAARVAGASPLAKCPRRGPAAGRSDQLLYRWKWKMLAKYKEVAAINFEPFSLTASQS
eukprot:g51269.t1